MMDLLRLAADDAFSAMLIFDDPGIARHVRPDDSSDRTDYVVMHSIQNFWLFHRLRWVSGGISG
ncbi:hypothetical protein SAMN05443661_102139 [Natronobacterium gregoryi]|uniref:Uncharacterized protein n=2 Tax=Natronobacterium gregoryi TaxID=44930 RepID=L0AH63_NATGS|nr:hypothetical protein Natgr_1943 [Natronobacterium gregoryi SP2]SFI60664.1 hypothetical protein SAMN05443661_102139 [Natronobacterium gregoryi]